jgi:hypothetical protein
VSRLLGRLLLVGVAALLAGLALRRGGGGRRIDPLGGLRGWIQGVADDTRGALADARASAAAHERAVREELAAALGEQPPTP